MSLKFWNTKFNIFCKRIFIFYIKCHALELRGRQGHSRTSKSKGGIKMICFNFLRNKSYVNKISSRNSTLYNFLIKISLESFVFSYHFINYLESSTKIFFTTSISHWTTGSSVKPSISVVTLSQNASWVPGILNCSLT